jgi:uncharacterized protein
MGADVLIVPGYGNSGPQHWQTLWEASSPSFERVVQRDWERPVCSEWCAALEAAVRRAGPQCLIVAHSLGCLTVAHWAAAAHSPLGGALLVAIPDAERPSFPVEARGFNPVPRQLLGFPSIAVTSSDDPYDPFQRGPALAKSWGSRLIELGTVGHINAGSGLGSWSKGLELLQELRRGA